MLLRSLRDSFIIVRTTRLQIIHLTFGRFLRGRTIAICELQTAS
jgi:hypothetical protein